MNEKGEGRREPEKRRERAGESHEREGRGPERAMKEAG